MAFNLKRKPVADEVQDRWIEPRLGPDPGIPKSAVFDLGRTYPSGDMTPAFAAIFAGLGIGEGVDPDPRVASATDPAWRSYRMKGSQTTFVTSEGFPTVAGQSITENPARVKYGRNAPNECGLR